MSENKYKYYRSTFYFEGKQYSATGKTQREADKKAAIKLDKMERGEVGISDRMKVKDYCAVWLETYKKGNVQPSTYVDYESRLNKLCEQIGSMSLKDVKDIHLQKFINSFQGSSFSQVDKYYKLIKSLFLQSYYSRLVQINPAENLMMPSYTKGKRRAITSIEREHILKVAQTHYAGLWIKTLLYSGLRTGESIALQWSDIDFKKGTINVNKAYDKINDEIKNTPKTDAGNRKVLVRNDFLKELIQYQGKPFEPVFKQITTGKRHTKSSIDKMWLSFKKELNKSMGGNANIKAISNDLVAYCLRHTYGTDLLLVDKVDLKLVSYFMGHSDIKITANIYTHVDDTVIEAARLQVSAM